MDLYNRISSEGNQKRRHPSAGRGGEPSCTITQTCDGHNGEISLTLFICWTLVISWSFRHIQMSFLFRFLSQWPSFCFCFLSFMASLAQFKTFLLRRPLDSCSSSRTLLPGFWLEPEHLSISHQSSGPYTGLQLQLELILKYFTRL